MRNLSVLILISILMVSFYASYVPYNLCKATKFWLAYVAIIIDFMDFTLQ